MSVVSGSKAWQYFCKEKSSKSATCKKCNVKITCKGFSTSGLLCHLKNAHKELDLDMKYPHKDTGSEIGNVQRKMTFVKQQAVEEIVSKLAVVDGFSINAIFSVGKIADLVKNKLSDFNLLMKRDIIASVINGASVIKKIWAAKWY